MMAKEKGQMDKPGADPGFQVRGSAIKKIVGVFRVKNHDFTQKKIIFFPILGGARVGCAPLDPPLQTVIYKTLHKYLMIEQHEPGNGPSLIHWWHQSCYSCYGDVKHFLHIRNATQKRITLVSM
jgi:hypothetical protein